jgi:hypothetical protein
MKNVKKVYISNFTSKNLHKTKLVCVEKVLRVFDRNGDQVGLDDFGPRPRVWKFYSRKKAKGFRILHEECMCQ